MEQIDHLDPGVLGIKGLVFGPPFPGHGIDQFGEFLGHGAGVVEHPLNPLLFGEGGGMDADALVELVLEAEDFFEFVFGHGSLLLLWFGSVAVIIRSQG
jgi:hypothetical protein